MKKLVSLALAVITILCLSVPAFATEVTEAGDYTAEVTGSYIAGTESNNTVYCVDIAWEDLDMTYHAAKEAVWDTDNLEYSVVTPAYWEGEGTITVTNRSNTRISAVPTYTSLESYSDADMTFSTNKLKVSTAELGTEESGSITVTPTGSLPDMEEATTIGTITLTIAQDPDATVEEAKLLVNKADNLEHYLVEHDDGFDEQDEEIIFLLSSTKVTLKGRIEAIETEGLDDSTQNDLNDAYNDNLKFYLKALQLYNNITTE